jgi:hypothetical protein
MFHVILMNVADDVVVYNDLLKYFINCTGYLTSNEKQESLLLLVLAGGGCVFQCIYFLTLFRESFFTFSLQHTD